MDTTSLDLEYAYRDLLQLIMNTGEDKSDRTNTGTRSLFGYELKGDISNTFPLFTGRKFFLKTVITELLWYIRGETTLEFLHQHGCKIWDAWADEHGDLGPVYGHQWRHAPIIDQSELNVIGINDQLQTVIDLLNNDNISRRMLINSWNPSQIDDMRLPPCAFMVQFYVRNTTYLDVRVDSRSADALLGLPHNIAVYSLLTYVLAAKCGYKPGRYTHHLGDVHIYNNHFDQVNEYLSRTPRPHPTLFTSVTPETALEDLTHDSFDLRGYEPYPTISAPVAV